MRWITRRRPKIDRLASPWLIKRFVDREAQFLFVPVSEIRQTAIRTGAIPFDLPDGKPEVELVHPPGGTSFEAIRRRYGISDPAVERMATVVRAAGNDNLARRNQQAGGLRAISLGLAKSVKDDQERLACGMVIYEALYQWAKLAPVENSPLFRRTLSAVGNWVRQSPERQIRADLADLSDHLLRDVGLSRDDADRETGNMVWRP